VRDKVIVIGGGLAGLYLGWLARDLGMNVVVFEARPDCGGRVRSVPASALHGWDIDLGGELIGRNYQEIRQLCRLAGVRLIGFEEGGGGFLPATVVHQEHMLDERERRDLEAQLQSCIEMLCELSAGVDPVRPWRSLAPETTKLSQVSVEDWLVRRGFTARLAALFCDHAPRMQSVLGLLACIAGGGGHDYFYAGESKVIEGGAGQLVQFLTGRLGESIRTGHVVHQVTMSGGRPEAAGETAGGAFRETADAVVLATPSPCWPAVDWPELARVPEVHMTRNRKIVMELRWDGSPDVELSGLSDGVCRLAWPSPQSAVRSRTGAAVVSCLALPTRDVQQLPTATLARAAMELIGLPESALCAVHEVRWSGSPFARGTYPVFGPGSLSDEREVLLTGAAPLFFCGDWVLPGWAGLLEGAARSARLCLNQLVQYLGSAGTRASVLHRTPSTQLSATTP
jgi:monoamine oxidase